jgi:hypothetical protein
MESRHSTEVIVAEQLLFLIVAVATPTVLPPKPLFARYSMSVAQGGEDRGEQRRVEPDDAIKGL